MTFETFTVEVMECFATYIMYGDDSELHPTEVLAADGQLDKLANDYPGFIINIESDSSEFGRCEWLDLFGPTMTISVNYPLNKAA